MGKVISIQSTPERFFSLVEQRYAGFAAWEAFRLGDYSVVCAESLAELDHGLSLPLACRAMELVAMSNYYTEDYQSAVHTLERVTWLCSTHPICQLYLAESYGMTGRVDLAKELLICIVDGDTCDAELLMFVAGSFERLGFHQQALITASSACQADPHCGQYLADLSFYSYRAKGMSPVVESLARQSVQLEPNAIAFRVWLTTVLLAQSKFDEAYAVVATATDAQILEVDCPCCLTRLYELYQMVGDEHRACQCVQAIPILQFKSKGRSPVLPRIQESKSDLRIPSTVQSFYGDS